MHGPSSILNCRLRSSSSIECSGKKAGAAFLGLGIVLQILVGAGVWLLITEPQTFVVYFAMVSFMNSYIYAHTFSVQSRVLPPSSELKGLVPMTGSEKEYGNRAVVVPLSEVRPVPVSEFAGGSLKNEQVHPPRARGMDPLAVLKEFTVRNDLDSVRLVGDEYFFGDEYRFARNVETSYRSKQGSLYTLESLVYFVKNKAVKHTEYLQQARSLKLQIVTFTDRKPLQDFLEGKISTTDAIELLPPLPGLQHREDWPKRHAEDEKEAARLDDNVPSFKRTRTEADGSDNSFGAYFTEAPGKSMIDTVRERERHLRDRESILLCPNKNFGSVLTMLSRREEEKRRVDDQQKKESEKPMDLASSAPNPANRYVNVEEKRFWKDHLGTDAAEELGIDPSQSFADSIKPKDISKSKPDPRAVRSNHHHSHHRPPLSLSSSKKSDGPPIIIVPSASQTMLNTYNVKEFLEDGLYIAPDVKAKMDPKKPENLFIQRKMGREHPVKYEVRDKPAVLSSKDWERVVAVVVLGKEWQFKDWPFKDHVEIFNKMMGIFLRFEDDSVESAKTVKQWNVKILSLSKHKRHQDKTAVLAFWDSVDKSVLARK